MNNITRRRRLITITLAIFFIIVIITGIYFIYQNSRYKLLDKTAYKEFRTNLLDYAENVGFTGQSSMRGYITSWADDNGLKYRVDKSDNIIFNSKASALKKNVTPSVVCVSYNYATAADDAEALTSAAMIALTDINSGRKTVIFVNAENNSYDGYKGINKKYFSGKSKVIYLDSGEDSYLSTSSYGRTFSSVVIPAKLTKVKCDTVIKVHISGISSGEIGTDIDSYPNPISAFSALLTRLKSKSITYQLADFSVNSNGTKYPDSLDAIFVLNSYSVESFTKYIDKRIEEWEDTYENMHPELSYTYEVQDDDKSFPTRAYDQATAERLTNVLYTVKNGTYTLSADDELLNADNEDSSEVYKEGDIFGVNCLSGLTSSEGRITLSIISMACDEAHIKMINGDNQAAAELFDCELEEVSAEKSFRNNKKSLSRTLVKTFYKVSDLSGGGSVLEERPDDRFTPCSYLARKSKGTDVIHLKLNSKKATTLTNAILCYIATKGNFFSL